MTSAQYKDLNVNVVGFQKTFREYVAKAGWQVKDEIADAVTATFTLKKGLLNTTTVKVRGTAQDFFVEIIGATAVMDLVEQAVAASCEKPTSIIGWRDQGRLRSQQSSQTTTQSPLQVQPVVQQPVAKPPVPKLEACLHCGAPMTYNPEEYLIICEYCGFINNPSGEQPPRYSMLPVVFAGTKIIEIAKAHVAKGIFITKNMANQAEWGSIILRYVPNWVMTMQLRGSLQGDRALIKSKDVKAQVAQDFALRALGGVLSGMGKSQGRTIQQHRPATHSINETLDVFVVARRGAAYQPDVGVQKIPLEKKEPFQKVSDETLNVELSPTEAIEKAKGLALEDVRARFLSVSNFNISASQVGEPELIYTPWWFLEYKMGGMSYSLIVDACVGNVIAGKRPWLPKKTTEQKPEVTTVL